MVWWFKKYGSALQVKTANNSVSWATLQQLSPLLSTVNRIMRYIQSVTKAATPIRFATAAVRTSRETRNADVRRYFDDQLYHDQTPGARTHHHTDYRSIGPIGYSRTTDTGFYGQAQNNDSSGIKQSEQRSRSGEEPCQQRQRHIKQHNQRNLSLFRSGLTQIQPSTQTLLGSR